MSYFHYTCNFRQRASSLLIILSIQFQPIYINITIIIFTTLLLFQTYLQSLPQLEPIIEESLAK